MMLRFFIIVSAFLLIIVSGIILHRKGRPYNPVLFNIHKLIALGCVVFTTWNLVRSAGTIERNMFLSASLIAAALSVIISFVTGGLMSAGKLSKQVLSWFHSLSSALLIMSAAAAIIIITNYDRIFKIRLDTAAGTDYISVPVAFVPGAFPVNFALFTDSDKQYVAYYDTLHRMTLACRRLADEQWDYETLDSKTGWDSHNYLALNIDAEGLIHLAGNMHSGPLIYFRSLSPNDIHSMQKVNMMTGSEEDVCTYPVFMKGPLGQMVFHYRYGRSGDGYETFNIWDPETGQWNRLLDQPLLDGEGKMNAYMQGPVQGPDGWYHLLWVWRDTPDCSTNHTLSYARSSDLVHWESIGGEKVELPLTIRQKELYVDDITTGGGLINTGIRIGFDTRGKILAGYHKYDSAGNTQMFLARFQDGIWIQKQVTNWQYRWDFKGMGSIVNELLVDPPQCSEESGRILLGFHHITYGEGEIIIDENNLNPLESRKITKSYPVVIDSPHSAIPGIVIHKVFDAGKPPAGIHYMLRWETLGQNRDQLPEDNLGLKSELVVIQY